MALAKLFGGGKKTETPKEAGPPANLEPFALYPPRARNGLDPKKMDEFAKRVAKFRRTYMAQRDDERLGSLQIYRFDRIRLRLSSRWDSIREKVYGIIESAFARGLGSDDLFVAASEEEYYVLITSQGRQDAEIRGSRLAMEITGKLLGTLPGGAAVTFKTMLFDFANGLDGVTTFGQLKARIDAFGRSIDESERALFSENSNRLRVHFKPTINLQKNIIAYYDTLIRSEEPNGNLLGPDAICPGSVNGVFDSMLDEWVVKHVTEVLRGPISKTRSQIIVPVHYETLAAMRFRDDFLAACRRLPNNSSSNMIFHFCDLSPGVPQSRIRELSAYIRPFCSGLIATLPNHQIYTEHLESTGVRGAMVDVSNLDPESPDVEKMLLDLAAKTKTSKLRSVIANAWSVKLSHHGFNAGINYLNGDALMKPLRAPAKVMLVPKA